MAANTYTALATQVLGSAASTVTFNSIPQGYTDLVLIYSGTVTATGKDVRFYYNNEGTSTTKYSYTWVGGNGTSASSGRLANNGYIPSYALVGSSASNTTWILNIMNYSNTTTYKTCLLRNSDAPSETIAYAGLWRDTSAINSITLYPNTNQFAAGSTFTLYGVAAASVGAYATGGTIYQDSTYFYHVFAANGTFTPSQALSADVLVVAGGGGGGYDRAAGGGAGGLLFQSARSCSSGTGYTVTIGAAGAGSTSYVVGASGGNTVFDTITANGGGGGGSASPGVYNGANGGSGGGGSGQFSGTGGTATQGNSGGATGYGFAGGAGSGIPASFGALGSGGGGGAGAAGQAGNDPGTGAGGGYGGAGGVGLSGSTISALNAFGAATGIGQLVSSNYYFAGGGGGGTNASTNPGAGGYGGGRAAGDSGHPAGYNGTSNTGGGGGGGNGGLGVGGNGGSGVVIVRYAK